VFLVAGARRLGKTSLLRQLPAHLPDGFFPVLFGLADDPAEHLDRLLWRLADVVAHQVGPRPGLAAIEPVWADFEGHTEQFLDRFWPEIAKRLGDQSALLMLDDLDSLARDKPDLLESFVAVLALWRSRHPDAALVATVGGDSQDRIMRQAPRLFGGGRAYGLGPLSSEEAIHLITWPVDGILAYDYGVPRRLVEITSGQPYYLQMVCFEITNRCLATGWVNQRDLDRAMADLVGREIPEFRHVWDESSPREQAVLAALVSLRGARGVATVREVQQVLTKAGARVDPRQLEDTLERLAAREILERLGALIYRFRIGLLRDWLDSRLDLREVVQTTRWAPPARGKAIDEPRMQKLQAQQPQRKENPQPKAEPAGAAGDRESQPTPRRLPWPWIAAPVALAVVGLVLIVRLLRPGAAGSAPTPVPLGSSAAAIVPAVTRTPLLTQPPTPARRPTESSTAMPSVTRSPTAPIILARPVPSIAYLSRAGKERPWILYVMSSDGSNKVPLIEATSDFLSAPAWAPDGKRMAFVSAADGTPDIWVMDVDGQNATNLTRDRAKDHSPAWSPDGQWIAFASLRESLYWQIYSMRADGSDVQRLTFWEDASDLSPSWSPDGQQLAFASKRDGNWEIYAVGRDGSGLMRLTENPASDTNPAWSPDGTQIAFQSDRDGYTDILVMPAGGGDAANLTRLRWATDLGPTWSPDGGRIAFYSDRGGNWDVYVMNSDGSNLVNLTAATTDDELPAWRP
jgi:hypothetical protein